MGSASFEAIGISELPLPFITAPIENSPPGIQTILGGPLRFDAGDCLSEAADVMFVFAKD